MAKTGQIKLLTVEKLLMKWRKGIKRTKASELDWVGEQNLLAKCLNEKETFNEHM